MNILGRVEGKLVVKKAVGCKSLIELSVQIVFGLVSKTMYLGFALHPILVGLYIWSLFLFSEEICLFISIEIQGMA